MRWIHPLSPEVEETAEVLGGKAHGLVVLQRLGLPVPPGFVISTGACRAFLRGGRFPVGSTPSWRPPSPVSRPPPGGASVGPGGP
jgi:pyruvate, orthophosphate dikinase